MTQTRPARQFHKYFTVEEANKTLPLVRKIVADIVRQNEIVSEFEHRLKDLAPRRLEKTRDVYAEELAHRREELEAEQAKLSAFADELARLGVELKGPDGLCDFPAWIDGREAYLCWRLGEPEVTHWHELNSGFAGRKPIASTSGTVSSSK